MFLDKNDIFIQFIQNKEIIYQTSKNFNEESYNFELKISVTNQETLQDHPIQLQLMKEKADIDLIGKIILNCDDIIQGNGENIQISGKFSNESDEIVGEFSLEGTYQA